MKQSTTCRICILWILSWKYSLNMNLDSPSIPCGSNGWHPPPLPSLIWASWAAYPFVSSNFWLNSRHDASIALVEHCSLNGRNRCLAIFSCRLRSSSSWVLNVKPSYSGVLIASSIVMSAYWRIISTICGMSSTSSFILCVLNNKPIWCVIFRLKTTYLKKNSSPFPCLFMISIFFSDSSSSALATEVTTTASSSSLTTSLPRNFHKFVLHGSGT